MTERQILLRLKELRKKNNKTDTLTKEQKQNKINMMKKWITYYRLNPEIYIEKRMRFHSFGYQNFSYHLMGSSDQYIEVSTRGTGK